MEGPGALAGWEFSEQLDAKELGQTIAQQALVKLGAKLPVGSSAKISEGLVTSARAMATR